MSEVNYKSKLLLQNDFAVVVLIYTLDIGIAREMYVRYP